MGAKNEIRRNSTHFYEYQIFILALLVISFQAQAQIEYLTYDGMPPRLITNKTDEIRDPATVRQFKRLNPCPVNGRRSGPCPGYVVDHVTALKCNGLDSVENMQWQTKAQSKLKDRWEVRGGYGHKPCSGDRQ